MTKGQFIRRFNAIKRKLGENRDELRELLEEADGVKDSVEGAMDYMDAAAERLSEQL